MYLYIICIRKMFYQHIVWREIFPPKNKLLVPFCYPILRWCDLILIFFHNYLAIMAADMVFFGSFFIFYLFYVLKGTQVAVHICRRWYPHGRHVSRCHVSWHVAFFSLGRCKTLSFPIALLWLWRLGFPGRFCHSALVRSHLLHSSLVRSSFPLHSSHLLYSSLVWSSHLLCSSLVWSLLISSIAP